MPLIKFLNALNQMPLYIYKYILQFTNLYTNTLNSKDIEIDLVVTNEMPALVYSTSFFMQF